MLNMLSGAIRSHYHSNHRAVNSVFKQEERGFQFTAVTNLSGSMPILQDSLTSRFYCFKIAKTFHDQRCHRLTVHIYGFRNVRVQRRFEVKSFTLIFSRVVHRHLGSLHVLKMLIALVIIA